MLKQLLHTAFLLAFFTKTSLAQVVPTVVSAGFDKGLLGIELAADGKLWVAESGSGNGDGRITIVDPATGAKAVFMDGLPSEVLPGSGEISGPSRVIHLPNNRLLVMAGEGGDPLAEALHIVDLASYTGSPLTTAAIEQTIKIGDFVHGKGFVNCNPFNLTWDAAGDMFIADSGANSILKRDKTTGELSVVTTFPPFPNPLPFGPPVVDPVPTKVLAKPGGGFYVCQLTGFPFLPGAANVYNLAADGTTSVHQSGFTLLTDMAFHPADGALCVNQFGEFGPVDTTFNFIIGTAKIIKLNPDGSQSTIASGIGGLSPSFCFAPNGDIYATDLVFGMVVKFALSSAAGELPKAVASAGAFPNPFFEKTRIGYELLEAADVSLEIYDLQGRRVFSKEEGRQPVGQHFIDWEAGEGAATGAFAWRLNVGGSLLSGYLQRGR